MFIQKDTLDDLLREVFEALLKSKNRIQPSKGSAREEFGVLLELRNPRARLSQTETRSTLFSCIGEFLWYLSRADSLEFIQYYIPRYEEFSDNGNSLYGAYGPRIFNFNGVDQYSLVKDIIHNKTDSRQAVIQIYDREDTSAITKDLPCTCTLQFAKRNGKLHMHTSMRSNDAYLGLPHDVFAFTMLQEMLATESSVEVGTYKHSIGSLHLYDRDRAGAQRYLDEGWQSSLAMPAMPKNDFRQSLRRLLEAEEAIRKGVTVNVHQPQLDSYWADLIRLLQIYSLLQDGNKREVVRIKSTMSTKLYESHIRRKQLRPPPSPVQGRLPLKEHHTD